VKSAGPGSRTDFLFLLFIVNNVVSARKLMDPGIRYDIVDESEVPDNPFDSCRTAQFTMRRKMISMCPFR
jgi:hypothetical protein